MRSSPAEIAVAAFLALVFVADLAVGATSCRTPPPRPAAVPLPSGPLFASTLPADAALSPTTRCFAWSGGSAPSGTTWYLDLVATDTATDQATLQVTAATDAGVLHPCADRIFLLEVGIVPGDAGAVEIKDLRAFLRNHGVHEVDARYRCRIGAAGCPASPLHSECEVWADRFADASIPPLCRCGSGCLVSTNGTTWTAAAPGIVYGPRAAFEELVKPSGSGVCRTVPCGLLEDGQDDLAGLCP